MGERISDTATEAQEGLIARWRKHIQDQPASGLTQKAYCSGQGLSIQVARIVLRQNFHQDALRRTVEILEC
jgi:ribosomal protein S25